MSRSTTSWVVVGTFLLALLTTGLAATYLPLEMQGRLFAAGLSFVPVWVLLAITAIGLRRGRWTKALYDFHSHLGVGLGVLVFATVFSGTVAVLAAELSLWESKAQRRCTPGDLTIDEAIADAQRRFDGFDDVVVMLPSNEHPCLTIQQLNEQRWNGIEWLHYDRSRANAVVYQRSGATWLLRRMHTNFVAQNAIGRYASGFVGVFFMLSALAGLLMHRRIREQAYSLNSGGSPRKMAADLHKGVGVWAFPFHMLMGLTGAWVGLAGLVTAIIGIATLGSQEAVIEAILGPQADPTGIEVPMVDVDEAVARVLAEERGSHIEFLFLQHWNDENARMHVNVRRGDRLGDALDVELSGADGTRLGRRDFSEEGPYRALYATIAPLHFGTFGGTPLKLLYFGLGCVMCVLIASGLNVWIAHREQGAQRPRQWPARLATGACAGIVVGTALLLALCSFYPPEPDPFLLSTGIYFGAWAATIVAGLVSRAPLRCFVARCALVSALGFVAAAATRAIGDPGALRNPSTLVIELVLVLSAAALWTFARRIEAVPAGRLVPRES